MIMDKDCDFGIDGISSMTGIRQRQTDLLNMFSSCIPYLALTVRKGRYRLGFTAELSLCKLRLASIIEVFL